MSTTIDTAAVTLGNNLEQAESNLLRAYSENFKDQAAIDGLAKDLGVVVYQGEGANRKKITPTLKSLQLIAEQRYQHKSQSYSLFSNLLGKADQMKQQLIAKIGR